MMATLLICYRNPVSGCATHPPDYVGPILDGSVERTILALFDAHDEYVDIEPVELLPLSEMLP